MIDEQQDGQPDDGMIEAAKRDRYHRMWLQRIETAQKERSDFDTRCKKAVTLFGLDRKADEKARRRFEIAWANREIIQAAIYERPPVCVVKPRHSIANAQSRQVARRISEILERAVNTDMEIVDAHSAFESARDGLADFSLGSVWVRYEPTIETRPERVAPDVAMTLMPPGEPMMIGDDGLVEVPVDVVTDERCIVEPVMRGDLLWGKAQAWHEVPWVARRVRKSVEKARERFPDAQFRVKTEDDTHEVAIWEIWCRDTGMVYFVSPDAATCLEVSEPFLDLSSFWPCPRPALGTTTDGSLIPIPDVGYYEGQLKEINTLTARINAITDALKVKGFYASGASRDGADAIEQAVKSQDDRAIMVPVPGWVAMTQGGRLPVEWLPVDQVVAVLTQAIAVRRQIIEDVFQISGISDILRGSTEASETATAQSIKARWGGIRLRRKQGEMVRLARDTARIVAEIMAEKFQPETLIRMAQVDNDELTQAALQVMRDDRARSLVIDIETDSTVQADEQMEQQRRIEFAGMLGQMLTQAGPIVSTAPELAPLVGDAIKFVVRGFRVGREMEQTIEDAIGALVERISQPQPAAPDPAMAKVEADANLGRMKLEADVALRREKMAADQMMAVEKMAMQPPPDVPLS